MHMITAVDRNWAIGKDNSLLVSIPSDMKFFRQTTSGKVVIMGRKTLESFPNAQPLKNRTNIVLTRNTDYAVSGALVCHSVEEVLEAVSGYAPEDVYCIGGESIYRLFLPYTQLVHVTKIDHAYAADAWFPNLDELPEWKVTGMSDEQTYFDLTFHFVRYERTEA